MRLPWPRRGFTMTPGLKRGILAVIFIGIIAGPVVYRRFAHKVAPTSVHQQDAIDHYGFTLTEVAAASGINFAHTPPKIDEKLRNIEPQIASMGASVSIVDFDNDGLY